MIELAGRIQKLQHYNESTNYVVGVFVLNDTNKKIPIRGPIHNPSSTYTYSLLGEYKEFDIYGKQFVINEYLILDRSNETTVIKFLSSNCFTGVGKKTATLLVQYFQQDCLSILLKNPEQIHCIKEFTLQKKEILISMFLEHKNTLEVGKYFIEHEISIGCIKELIDLYGYDVLSIIQTNPYQCMQAIDNFTLVQGDEIVRKINLQNSSYNRVLAAIQYILKKHIEKTGSIYIDLDKLHSKLFYHNIMNVSNFEEYIEELELNHSIVYENELIYDYTLYHTQQTTIRLLQRRITMNKLFDNEVLETIQNLEVKNKIIYNEQQKETIQLFLNSSFMLLSGGPGTGKTTVVKAMVQLYKSLYPNEIIYLLAPTGRAAKRLGDLTNQKAMTIHRFLKWDGVNDCFLHTQDNPIDGDVIIVDESSMIDLPIMHSLLSACMNVKKMLFIGDHNQLPSVGPGCIFYDMIQCGLPNVILTEIYRQGSHSGIIPFASNILNDTLENIEQIEQFKDVYFYPCVGDDLKNNVLKVFEGALKQGYLVDDIQLLSPIHLGDNGIRFFNRLLQGVVNPFDKNKLEYVYGTITYRQGDKVLLLKNKPEDDVYNGDVGILKEIHYKDNIDYFFDSFLIDFNGIEVVIEKKDFPYITHAYCMSIHKTQGSEFKVILCITLDEHDYMLYKNLFYTAVTRASELLFILGQEHAVINAIQNNRFETRKSTFVDHYILHSLK